MTLYYNKTSLISDGLAGPFGLELVMYLNVHHPNQFLLEVSDSRYDNLRNTEGGRYFLINNFEELRRRNSRNKRCSEDWRFYDDLVWKKHIKTKGCRAPYHGPYESYPICNTREDIKESTYDFDEVRKKYYPKACHRISKIDFDLFAAPDNGLWGFGIEYPEEVKIITQSKEIDEHALIGNIGGYIELFLGNLPF